MDRVTGTGKRLGRNGGRHLSFQRLLRRARRRGHIAMIHIGRSGSTVLAELLGQHPLITWDGEIYQRVFREREREDGSLPPITDVDPVEYLLERSEAASGRYYGFEVKFFHVRVFGADLGAYLDELDGRLRDLRFVVLERRNTLRVVVSTLAARQTGVWHVRGDTRPPRTPVRVDVDAVFVNREPRPLVELLAEFSSDFSALGRLLERRPSLHLTYEEDVAEDPRRAYARICEHLGLAPHPATTTLARTNPHPLRELIENFAEVEHALGGTEFAWMLEDAWPLPSRGS